MALRLFRLASFGKRLFAKPQTQTPAPNTFDLARSVGRIMDGLARDLFEAHRETLLHRPPSYVVPGVFGVARDTETCLDEEQQRIHEKTAPVVDEALHALNLQGLAPDQEFAVAYMLRSMLISRIGCLVETRKNQVLRGQVHSGKNGLGLEGMEPLGSA